RRHRERHRAAGPRRTAAHPDRRADQPGQLRGRPLRPERTPRWHTHLDRQPERRQRRHRLRRAGGARSRAAGAGPVGTLMSTTGGPMNEPTAVPQPGSAPRERLEAVLYELRRVIVGQDRLLDRILVALMARGHVLVEGVPGLAKTLTLETTARVAGGHFSRIQFTPDLVPSDVVGGQVL